jgi:hypothetical protein
MCRRKEASPSKLRCQPDIGHFATPALASMCSKAPVKGQKIQSFAVSIPFASTTTE